MTSHNQYKIAFITGASVGIGLETARRFSQQGVSLVLLARRRERLEQLAKELSVNAPCHVIACDVRDLEQLDKEIENLPETFSQIDILINNAGLSLGLVPAHTADWADWRQMIDTNCTSLAFITRRLLPGMVSRNRGHVVNLGSIAGSYAYPGGNVYSATKAFVEHFSRSLRADLLGTAVRVTNIEPGMTGDTEFSLVRFHGDREEAEAVYRGADYLKPADIAEAICWSVSQPPHVNINRMEIMPVCQATGPLAVDRKPTE